ncbi:MULTISPECIES: response regulator transcription factor [Dermacoccus]|uniref:Response regulator transcription factor n=1 Tax=Dermacoccus profundi TaxID=322602 RepID=A0ABN2DFF5_9MICO
MAQLTDPDARVRVLVADDENLMRAGLRLMIDGARGIEVVGEAADGAEAVTLTRELDPDVVLMDVRMPRMNGLDATRALADEGARARVVVLTAFDTDDYLLDALRGGAVSFLLKDSPPEAVVEAVLDAARGGARFSPSVLTRLVRLAAGRPAGAASAPSDDIGLGGGSVGESGPGAPSAVPSPAAAPAGVTEREWEVAQLIAQGLTNAEIAQQLYLSMPTIKTHTSRLFDKLGVTNRVQLAIRVLELSET